VSDTFDHEGDAWAQFDDWVTGGCTDEPGPYRYAPTVSKQKTCRECGKAGLRWGNVKGGRWRLFEGGIEHVCSFKKY